MKEIKKYHSYNHSLKEIYFINEQGKKHGLHKQYFLDGTLASTWTYNNGISKSYSSQTLITQFLNGWYHGIKVEINYERN